MWHVAAAIQSYISKSKFPVEKQPTKEEKKNNDIITKCPIPLTNVPVMLIPRPDLLKNHGQIEEQLSVSSRRISCNRLRPRSNDRFIAHICPCRILKL